jgi:hypothetical protein
MAVRGIEDRETAHPEGRVAGRFESSVVGAAMNHRGAHPIDGDRAVLARALRINESGYAAHQERELTGVLGKASLRHVLAEATGSGRSRESHSTKIIGYKPYKIGEEGCA